MQEILDERIDTLIKTLESIVPPVPPVQTSERAGNTTIINAPNYGYGSRQRCSSGDKSCDAENEGLGILALLFLILGSLYTVAKDEFVRYWLRGIDQKMMAINEFRRSNPEMIDSLNDEFIKWKAPYHKYIRIWWYSKIAIIISLTGLFVGLVCNVYILKYTAAAFSILSILNICWKTWTDDVYVYENQQKHNENLIKLLDKLRSAHEQCK
jgi:hypothetical protein